MTIVDSRKIMGKENRFGTEPMKPKIVSKSNRVIFAMTELSAVLRKA